MLQKSENHKKECLDKNPQIIKNRKIWLFYILLSLLSPLFSIYDILKPISEHTLDWFQRSGSLMVIFSVLAETYVVKMEKIIELPSGMTCKHCFQIKEIYSKKISIYKIFSISLIIVGTIVWGYGDVLIESFE